MKKILLRCISLLLMLMLLVGCQPAENPNATGDSAVSQPGGKTVSANSVERLVNSTYRKHLGRHKLYCCDDYVTDDGIFHATFYGDDDRIEFFVEYDPETKVLKSNAAGEYHEGAIRDSVGKLIEETTGLQGGELETDTYSIRIQSEKSETFIEDYDAFVSDKGTKIDILLVFDKKVSDTEVAQIQTIVKKLQEQHFQGELTYCGDGDWGEEIEF